MELISYALDFTSFLIQNLKDASKIRSIILFGSAARGEATKESDVDIFLDFFEEKEAKIFERNISEIKIKFFKSVKFTKYWKLLGIENEVSVIVDDINKWNLKDSLVGNSIILYQSYSPKLEKGKNKIILSWENVKPDSRRVMLNKKLFGYKHYKYSYDGILKNYNSVKLGSNVVLVDSVGLIEILKVFKHFRVAVKINRVFEYEV